MRRFLVLFLCVLLLPSVAHAAGDTASFESFYRTSSSINWWLVGVITVGVVAVVIATGGTAAPGVAWVGTLIGNAMGLSGAAATNAGLSLLGGGSLASGGFGMFGGTILLTTVLSFSTEVIVDYGVGWVVSEYQYRDLVARSETLATLPLPSNRDGPAAYQEAIEALKEIDADLPLHAQSNQTVIDAAIRLAEQANDDAALTVSAQIRLAALVSLLKFQKSDFRGAKEYAGRALAFANIEGIAATLPAFVYASSSLYDEKLDVEMLTDTYLAHAVLLESSNKLIPLLFAIYLDRVMLRIDQGDLGPEAFRTVSELMEEPALMDHRLPNLMALGMRYLKLAKLEQQRISSLATTANDTLRNSPATLQRIERAMDDYVELLKDLGPVLDTLRTSVPRGFTAGFWGDEAAQWEELVQLRQKYLDDKSRLGDLISELATYQAERARLAAEARRAEEARIAEEVRQAEELQRKRTRERAMIWIAGLILVAGGVFVVLRRRRSTQDANLIAVARREEHRATGE